LTTGIIKPVGLPTLQSGNPLAADMLFYGVDLGNGTIVDVAGGNTMIAAGVPASVNTSFGRGIDWPNQDLVGNGYYANVSSTIQNALNLVAAPSGAGFTFGCTFVQLGPVVGIEGLIFGRPAHAAEALPDWNEAFTTTGNDDHG
jgi:hypothetical protein